MPVKYRILPEVSPQDAERFWSHVDIRTANECWPWTAGVNDARDGYGRFWIKRIEYRTNRMAYWLHYGVDPGKDDACHKCDNPPCCNPAHLFKGTRAINLADMKAKGRASKGEHRGAAKLTDNKVAEIRRQYYVDGLTQSAIAKQFDVSPSNVEHIVNFKVWKHVHCNHPIDQLPPSRFRKARGEKNHMTKLTQPIVLTIRSLYATGLYSHLKIAGRLGISEATVQRVVKRTTWTHV